MKQLENTLQDLKRMLIEDGYYDDNIVLRTLIKAQQQLNNLNISNDIKSLSSPITLAEKFAETKKEYVLKCRIEKDSIANLGLYLGFIEGYNYRFDTLYKLKRFNK